MKNDQTILLHCHSAIRATNFFMAWLIKYKGYTVNEAVKTGRSMSFQLPLEKLLGTEVSMGIMK